MEIIKNNKMKDILIYGASGYGREIACLINRINEKERTWNILGFIDDNQSSWGKVLTYGKILGGIQTLNEWNSPVSVVFAIATPKVIQLLVSKVTNPNVNYPNIIDPEVCFLDKNSFSIGKGNIIGYRCRFSCDVQIGDFNILVNDSTFGHDVKIGSYNVLFPESRLSGMVVVGDANSFGMKSGVVQGMKIGSNTKIGAGSIIMRNTKDGLFYLGNPAKVINI